MTSTLEAEVADETALRERRAEVEQALAEVQQRETDLEQETAAEAPALARAQETWYRLSSLRERFRGTGGLAAERVRHLAEEAEEQRSGPDPDELEAQARQVRDEEREILAAVERDREALALAVDRPAGGRGRARAGAAPRRRRRPGCRRPPGGAGPPGRPGRRRPQQGGGRRGRDRPARAGAGGDRRPGGARPGRVHRAGDPGGRPGRRRAQPRLRARAGVQPAGRGRGPGRASCAPRSATPSASGPPRSPARRRSSSGWPARTAPARCWPPPTGSAACWARWLRCSACESGYETAIAAALGAAADAVAVVDVGSAVDAIRLLKDDDAGRAGLLVGSPSTPYDEARAPQRRCPPGARRALDLVTAPDELRPHRGAAARRDGRGRGAAARPARSSRQHPRWSR